mmetsp:Transcript_35642/g.113983  ORF Transcript_35642/g.113983 Transcript_35642/m.113983 type:complete len:828 (+) Transcript_35642:1059-3542(+)
MYKLTAICLHAGTAHGGHYHAYICDLATGQWRDANDSTVSVLEGNDLSALFKPTDPTSELIGNPGFTYSSSDAYFLIYRSTAEESPLAGEDCVPEPHASEFLEENKTRQTLQRAYEMHQRMLEIKVFAPTSVHESLQRHVAAQVGNLLQEQVGKALARDPPSITISLPSTRTITRALDQAREGFVREASAGDDLWKWAKILDSPSAPRARLRNYEVWRGEVGAPLDASDTSIGQALALRTSSLTSASLLFEVSGPDGTFEPWDEQSASAIVCAWDPSLGRLSLAPEHLFVVRVPTEESTAGKRSPLVGGVRRAVAARLGLGETSACEVALVALVGEQAGSELSDDTTALSGYGLSPGSVLCAEMRTADAPLQSVLLYERIQNTADLAFNHPDRPFDTEEFKLAVSKTATLSEIKVKMSEVLGVEAQSFHLRRSRKAAQLKDETKTLRQLGLADSGGMFVGKGAPCKPDQSLVQISLYSFEKGAAKSVEAFEHVVCVTSSVKHLREALFEPVLQWARETSASGGSVPFSTDGLRSWRRLRLRDAQVGKQFAILRDDRTLRSALPALGDGRLIAVQVLAVDEELSADDVVLAARPFRAREGRLHAATEVVLPKAQTVGDLRASLAARFQGLLVGAGNSAGFVAEGCDNDSISGAEANEQVQAAEDCLEFVLLPAAGPPLTAKRCATLRWGDSQLNATDEATLAMSISEVKDFRDGSVLVVRSRMSAKLASENEGCGTQEESMAGTEERSGSKRTTIPLPKSKAGARQPPLTSFPAQRERSLRIEVACPEDVREKTHRLADELSCAHIATLQRLRIPPPLLSCGLLALNR